MRYEILYVDDTGWNFCREETDNYEIYQISDDGLLMRNFYSYKPTEIHRYDEDEEWTEYIKSENGCEYELTEEEAFLLLL